MNYIKFRETSIITRIYTEQFGMQSYIINGIRSQRSRKGIAHFQALNLLDMIVYHKQTADIHRISEWKSSEHLLSIYTDFRKSCIAIFLSEVLYKCIKENEPNPEMFEFLHQAIVYLENMEENIDDFHLQFLVKLARFLGFGTEHYKSMISEDYENIIQTLSENHFGNTEIINSTNRRETLEYLLSYYREHSEGFGELKSYKVLREIFEN